LIFETVELQQISSEKICRKICRSLIYSLAKLLLNLPHPKLISPKAGSDMSTVAMKSLESSYFMIVCDERCAVVRQLASLMKLWDRARKFHFVDRDSSDPEQLKLVADLDATRWSLLLIDDVDERWSGPEAIPIILKNLPFGKIAAVAYILPGTMWLTHQLYMLVSRNRRIFAHPTVSTQH
jgi:predicted DCC family thiol-disulfide oxidoreductase YuxK